VAATTTQTSGGRRLLRRDQTPRAEPMPVRFLEWLAFAGIGALTVLEVVRLGPTLRSDLPELAAWLTLVVVSDILPVPLTENLSLALSLPVLMAAGMLYPAPIVGALALLGSTDLREIRGGVTLAHGLYNRSQIALSSMTGSMVFHRLSGNLADWPAVLLVAMLALTADILVNTLMVALASWLSSSGGPVAIVRRIWGRRLSFTCSYISFGLVAVLLAVVHQVAGVWGLLAFFIPIVLACQAFRDARHAEVMTGRVSEKTMMLRVITERIADERRDERLAVAAGLHDELLPPLYKVHLLGQVVRHDLASGQLLALEEDVPDLLRAATHASDAMRLLIRGLRHSALGPTGLLDTLKLLVRELESQTTARLHLELEPVGGTPVVQLLAYQVAREALRNAVRHANAKNIWLRVQRDEDAMRLVVQDDGEGFDVSSVDKEMHFGLQLMKERVELAGGTFQALTERRSGTLIVARLPAQTSANPT